jgi:hypothetical protein
MSSRHHKPIPRGVHPSSLLTSTGTPPTPWASPARAQRGSGASPCWEVAKASVERARAEERGRCQEGNLVERARPTMT